MQGLGRPLSLPEIQLMREILDEHTPGPRRCRARNCRERRRICSVRAEALGLLFLGSTQQPMDAVPGVRPGR